MKALKTEEFYSVEQFQEHRKILKLPNVRYHNLIETGNSILVFYKQGIADNCFLVEYHSEGGTSLYFHHASLDNPKTLSELLRKGRKEHHVTKRVRTHNYGRMNDVPDREPNFPEESDGTQAARSEGQGSGEDDS